MGTKIDYNDKLYHLNIQGVLMLSVVFMTMLTALIMMMSVKWASEIIHSRLDPIMNDECNTAGKCLVGEIFFSLYGWTFILFYSIWRHLNTLHLSATRKMNQYESLHRACIELWWAYIKQSKVFELYFPTCIFLKVYFSKAYIELCWAFINGAVVGAERISLVYFYKVYFLKVYFSKA